MERTEAPCLAQEALAVGGCNYADQTGPASWSNGKSHLFIRSCRQPSTTSVPHHSLLPSQLLPGFTLMGSFICLSSGTSSCRLSVQEGWSRPCGPSFPQCQAHAQARSECSACWGAVPVWSAALQAWRLTGLCARRKCTNKLDKSHRYSRSQYLA